MMFAIAIIHYTWYIEGSITYIKNSKRLFLGHVTFQFLTESHCILEFLGQHSNSLLMLTQRESLLC